MIEVNWLDLGNLLAWKPDKCSHSLVLLRLHNCIITICSVIAKTDCFTSEILKIDDNIRNKIQIFDYKTETTRMKQLVDASTVNMIVK